MLPRSPSIVPRKAPAPRRNKPKITVSLDAELLDWIEARAGSGQRFASVSHAIERAVRLMRERGEPPE